MDVTFETKCWENDYLLMLKTGHLKSMITNCNYPFAHRQFIINNVRNEKKVKALADRCVRKGIIDCAYTASEFADEAFAAYGIEPESFRGGISTL